MRHSILAIVTSCRNAFQFFRQFGAEKASNGSVKFFVGFAEKSPRQKGGGGAPQTTQNIGLLLVLAVASIVAILF